MIALLKELYSGKYDALRAIAITTSIMGVGCAKRFPLPETRGGGTHLVGVGADDSRQRSDRVSVRPRRPRAGLDHLINAPHPTCSLTSL